MSRPTKFPQIAGYIWSLANLPRGNFRQSRYGRVILPFTILRRLLPYNRDCCRYTYQRHRLPDDYLRQHGRQGWLLGGVLLALGTDIFIP